MSSRDSGDMGRVGRWFRCGGNYSNICTKFSKNVNKQN